MTVTITNDISMPVALNVTMAMTVKWPCRVAMTMNTTDDFSIPMINYGNDHDHVGFQQR